jgi:hypothetical protein
MSDPRASILSHQPKGKTMNCEKCDTTENIVMSGVDAFMLGVQTETICYTCANVSDVRPLC